jgi:excisionase family DNA binding protein
MRILRPLEIARRIGCTPKYVGYLIDSGKLRGYRLPGSLHRRVREDVLDAFIRDRIEQKGTRKHGI